jgi:hypothetical protein
MTRRVLVQRGSEVGAARVAAAQRARDVRGAQVVVELGFGECAEEGSVVVAGCEVEEGARDGGGGEAAVEGEVVCAQVAADVKLQTLDCARPRHGKRDH